MDNIRILKMEYEQMGMFTMGSCYERVNVAIRVEFYIEEIKGKIRIPIEDVDTMDEQKVKHYIYNYLNSKLERKFIDEI